MPVKSIQNHSKRNLNRKEVLLVIRFRISSLLHPKRESIRSFKHNNQLLVTQTIKWKLMKQIIMKNKIYKFRDLSRDKVNK